MTELHQFLRIPLLLSHLKEHRETEPGLSLFAFLYIHYATGHHPDDRDDREDNELPFKSVATIQHTDPGFPFLKELFPDIPEICLQSFKTFHPEGDPLSVSYGIFHPPRLN